MVNVKTEVKNGKVVITIDPTERHGESASKKNIIVASTGGNIEVEGVPGLKLGLNAYIKNEK